MMEEFMLQVTTPEGVFYRQKVRLAEIPVSGGRMGVYGGHEPAAAALVPGILVIYDREGKKEADLEAGFAEILPDRVRILTGAAWWSKQKGRAEE